MRIAVVSIGAALVVLAACGSGESPLGGIGSAELDGTGPAVFQPATVVSSYKLRDSPDPSQVFVVMTAEPHSCEELQAWNFTGPVIALNVQQTGSVTPKSYSIVGLGQWLFGDKTNGMAFASWESQFDPDAGSEDEDAIIANAGFVSFTRVDSEQMEGSFDVTYPDPDGGAGSRVTGTFSAPYCQIYDR